MIRKLIKKDFKKNKVITFTLFVFILLSAMLVSSATIIVTELNGSLNYLFEKAKVPSYVQMYSGEIAQKEINEFTAKNDLVKQQQTVKMLGVSGGKFFLQGGNQSEVDSIIENSFVKQNEKFDFLLDTTNNIAQVAEGEIGVPVYHQQQYQLEIGSKVRIKQGAFQKTYTIACFIRDAQMNPSLVTSKRFLVSDSDWHELEKQLNNQESLIEFQLKDEATISDFEKAYESSNLPQSGTALTRTLYQVLNALTDGLVVAIITLISFLLLVVAALCLRFTILTAIEEDYREIGIMKAIGISNKNTRKIYLTKYVLIAMSACFGGYLCSLGITQMFTQSMSAYMGTAPKTSITYLLPLLGSTVVFLFIYFFCRIVFRRFKKISALSALQAGAVTGNRKVAQSLKLSGKRRWIRNNTIFIGIREVLTQARVYVLLTFVFSICLFLMSVPFNFLRTVQSPSFISYMGAGKSDLRIDYHQVTDNVAEFQQLTTQLKADSTISKQALYTTSAYQVKNKTGELTTIKIENTTDYATFPLSYTSGTAPKNKQELALSIMNADELEATIGETVIVLLDGQEAPLTVSGIYQDVTNGGKTAKGMLPSKDILWYTINFDLQDPALIADKKAELEKQFKQIKITDTDDYINQTLGGIIQKVTLISWVAFVLALLIAVLITTMFFKMMLAKEAKAVAIMKSIGIAFKSIQQEYFVRAIFTLIVGIGIGLVATNFLGSQVASLLLTGVSNVTFVIHPLINYLVMPLSFVIVVSVSVYFTSLSIRKIEVILATE